MRVPVSLRVSVSWVGRGGRLVPDPGERRDTVRHVVTQVRPHCWLAQGLYDLSLLSPPAFGLPSPPRHRGACRAACPPAPLISSRPEVMPLAQPLMNSASFSSNPRYFAFPPPTFFPATRCVSVVLVTCPVCSALRSLGWFSSLSDPRS